MHARRFGWLALLVGCATPRGAVRQPEPEAAPSDGPRVVELAAGARHTCALFDDGHVRCWPQLVTEGVRTSGTPSLVDGLLATRIAASGDATCAVAPDGSVSCWGEADFIPGGASTAPIAIKGVPAVSRIALAQRTACGSGAEGIVCWGDRMPIASTSEAHGPSLAAPPGGKNLAPWPVDANGSADIVAGTDHFCALGHAGSVQCWGANTHGELGGGFTSAAEGPTEALVDDADAIAAERGITCAFTSRSEVYCWGGEGNDLPAMSRPIGLWVIARVAGVPSPDDIVGGAASGDALCALVAEGRVTCMTRNRPKAFELDLQHVIQIVAGDWHMCALSKEGDVRCWGADDAAPTLVVRSGRFPGKGTGSPENK